MDLGLKGRSALITGAAKGIGFAAAESLAQEGCNVHLASRTKADLEAAQAKLKEKYGVRVAIHPVDLSVGDAARARLAALERNRLLARIVGHNDMGRMGSVAAV